MVQAFTAIAAAGLFAAGAAAQSETAQSQIGEARWAIVIHGGAGVIERDAMDAATEAAYRGAMEDAVRAGGLMLESGADSIDVVEEVIRTFEDDEKFNAGRGAVFTSEGRNELDASIMRGSDAAAGAVAAVTTVRHPITLARRVMEQSPHVMLISDGAEAFAAEQGMEAVDPAHFFTERRWRSMQRAVDEMGLPAPSRPSYAPAPEAIEEGSLDRLEREKAFGTVGVVALDVSGVVVAGTSTGGTTAKRWGRVGDSPIIGAGTYAFDQCGVSATGTGEYFIRANASARLCMLAEDRSLAGLDPAERGARAAEGAIAAVEALGGDGGVVALVDGAPVWAFNTPGMYRASWAQGAEPVVSIFGDED